MSRPKSEFLKAFGTSFEIFKAVADAVIGQGGSDDDLRRLLSDRVLRFKVAQLIVGEKRTEADGAKNSSVFSIAIQPHLSAADRIAAGHYDWWNEDILKWRREDSPSEPRGEVEELDLGRNLSTENALAEIDKRDYWPANIEELCDYGAKNPDAQRKHPIIALGSVFVGPVDGDRCSPFLVELGAGRGLSLRWHVIGWGASCRFAAVRKNARKSGSGH